MKKITFFTYNAFSCGGVEKVLSIIANELVKNYDVEILSLCKTAETPFFKFDSNIKIINLFETGFKFPDLEFKTWKWLKKYKTDIFVNVGMKYIHLTMFMKKRAKSYISWEHSHSFNVKTGSKGWILRKIAAIISDKIVVLTKRDMQENIRKFNTKNKIVQIYNPSTLYEENENIKKAYQSDSNKIITVGRLVDDKGYDNLIEVAKIVFDKHNDWEWHIYGDGELKEQIAKAIQDNNLQDNLKLMGTSNRIQELYNDYAFFVMTSRTEGFPMVNIEAHYNKLPIVSFDCNCGPNEVIEDGVNGYLIECFDINKMAVRINYLIENANVRKEFSDNTGLDKEKLKLNSIMEQWEKLL